MLLVVLRHGVTYGFMGKEITAGKHPVASGLIVDNEETHIYLSLSRPWHKHIQNGFLSQTMLLFTSFCNVVSQGWKFSPVQTTEPFVRDTGLAGIRLRTCKHVMDVCWDQKPLNHFSLKCGLGSKQLFYFKYTHGQTIGKQRVQVCPQWPWLNTYIAL